MRDTRRGQKKDSFIPQPAQDHHRRQYNYGNSSRDSDASFASSRPSSAGVSRPDVALVDAYKHRSRQAEILSFINSYLSLHTSEVSLPPDKTPSGKQIKETLKFLLQQLGCPDTMAADTKAKVADTKVEDELSGVLKLLKCPIPIKGSMLRAPNTPQTFPSFLALMHWLVQIANCNEHLAEKSGSLLEGNSMFYYVLQSYLNYIGGNDDSVEALDMEFVANLEKETGEVAEEVAGLESKCNELAAEAERLRTEPTKMEKLETEKSVLEQDVAKFHLMMGELNQRIEYTEKVLEDKREAIRAKVEETRRFNAENEELKKQVESQRFNIRDAERMKRELQAVERDIREAETARNAWEEKIWDLEATIPQKFKELEEMAMNCNQEARRLKLENIFQHGLKAKGSTPVDVMGIDYKSTLKPRLNSLADDLKKSCVLKLEEVMSLEQQSSELEVKIGNKRHDLSQLQSHIDEVEAQLNYIRTEIEDYLSRCALEAKSMVESTGKEAHALASLEREAADILKDKEVKLGEAIKQTEEQIQVETRELFTLVDSISTYKEHNDSCISRMKNKLSETAAAISNASGCILPLQLGANSAA